MATDQDILAAIQAYGGGPAAQQAAPAPGGPLLPVPGAFSTPTPTELPSLGGAGPAPTAANALVNPSTGLPEPVKLPPIVPEAKPVFQDDPGKDVATSAAAPAPRKGPQDSYQEWQDTADAGLTQLGKDKQDAALAENQAKTDTLTRRADATADNVKLQSQADDAMFVARKANEAQADQETAQWMKEQDDLSKKEPNPHRYWDNTSTFGKCFWLLGIAFGAIGASKAPGVKNAALEMFNAEIQQDMDSQRSSLSRQLDAMKARGQAIDKKAARRLATLSDKHTAYIQRLNSLGQAADLKAQAPGSADDKQAAAAAKAFVDQEKIKVASEVRKQKADDKQKALERAHADWRTQVTVNAENQRHAATIAQQDRALDEKATEHTIDTKTKYDLADEQLAAKVAAKTGAADWHKDLLPMPDQSMVRVIDKRTGKQKVDAQGNPVLFSVNKEQYKEAAADTANLQAKANGLSALRKAIDQEGGWQQVLAKNDNDINAALNQVADPMIKQMGGRFNKETANVAYELVLGENYNSLVGRLKGGGDEALKGLIAGQVERLPREAAAKLKTYNSNLADDPNAELVFGVPDTRTLDKPDLTGDRGATTATGVDAAPLHVRNGEDVAKYGDQVIKALPDDLASKVVDTLDAFKGQSPGVAPQALAKGLVGLSDYAKAHPDQAEAVKDAQAILVNKSRDAEAKAEEALAKFESVLNLQISKPSMDVARKLAEEQGLANISNKQLAELLKASHSLKGN